jgi:predicted DNA-binding transcriptional regulator AlpA
MNEVNRRFIFLTMKDLEELTCRKAPTIYRWIAGGLFPRPVHPTPSSSVWRQSDYEEWAESPKNWPLTQDKPYTDTDDSAVARLNKPEHTDQLSDGGDA